MRFTVHCPKCSSPRVTLQMDRDTVFFHNGAGRPFLHCAHCGTILYGEKAIEAIEVQKAAYDLKVNGLEEVERLRKQKEEQDRADAELAQLRKRKEEERLRELREKARFAAELEKDTITLDTKNVVTLIQKRNVGVVVKPTTQKPVAAKPELVVNPRAVSRLIEKRTAKGTPPAVAKAQSKAKASKASKAVAGLQGALTVATVRTAVEAKRVVETMPVGVRLVRCGNVAADQINSGTVLAILGRGLSDSER